MRSNSPIYIANRFLNETEHKLIYNNKEIYIHQNNKYIRADSEIINDKLIPFLLENELGDSINENKLRSIPLCIKALLKDHEYKTDEAKWLIDMEQPELNIPLKNGIISVHNHSDKYSFEYINKVSREFFTTKTIQTDYAPTVIANRFLQLVNEVFPEQDQRDCFQEFIGLACTRNMTFDKLAILFGMGANGKSALFTAIKSMLGSDCYSTLSLSDLEGKTQYNLTQLEAKFLNICDELPESKKISTDKIKNITSGGELTIRQIREKPRKIKSYTKLLFATNTLPDFEDKSDGTFRRIIILYMPKQFTDEASQDKRLVSENFWTDSGEVSGIFNWALEGLIRLLNRGYFIEPETSKQLKSQYRLNLNAERTFLLDNYEQTLNDTDRVSSFELYKDYEEYCKDFGITKCNAIKLGQEVKRTFNKISKTNPIMDKNIGKKVRFWVGLKPMNRKTLQVEHIRKVLEN